MADIVFVLDSSGSVGRENWQKMLAFLKHAVSNITLGPFMTQVGVVTYGNKATTNFLLNEYDNSEEMMAYININDMPWKDEETNTSGAIWYTHKHMFTEVNGDRPQAPNVAIVITDGESTRDANLTVQYAIDAKRNGITIVSVGIGSRVNLTELKMIASNESLVYQASNFDSLGLITSQLVTVACDLPVGKYFFYILPTARVSQLLL